jgi:hypothetical protein
MIPLGELLGRIGLVVDEISQESDSLAAADSELE